jgi:transposase
MRQELYGAGTLVAATVRAFLGDARRFSSFAQAVRYAGLDATVHSSGGKRTAGRLSRQGPPILRWTRPPTPGHPTPRPLPEELMT